ncbi:MAG: CBS domain-containing protein [Methanomassiliicoccales archaeon]|nr:CBS domain-containing protein [Methanomassiliicoccales archaeon]NYT14767.1 CBS domain-containing protein [Methanomassiliicoccales archaeon]
MVERWICDSRVAEIMTREVISVSKDQSIRELVDMFEKYDFNSFPVEENGRLIGIVTKLNLLKAFSLGLEFRRTAYLDMIYAENVGDVMRKATISLEVDDTVKRAIEYMVEFSLRSLPVVDNGKLVGMVSRKDVVRCLEMGDEEGGSRIP